MTGRTPPFDDIVEGDDPERARLEVVHDLLVAVGAPPELPPWLATAPPAPRFGVVALQRRRYTAIATVAVAATVLFGIGYAIGGRDNPREPVRTIAMRGPAGATASIALRPRDAQGNWPMVLETKGLPQLPGEATYTLWLTRGGKLADPCGTFVAGPASIEVPLNAPYRLKDYDGWVVVRTGTRRPFVLRTGTV